MLNNAYDANKKHLSLSHRRQWSKAVVGVLSVGVQSPNAHDPQPAWHWRQFYQECSPQYYMPLYVIVYAGVISSRNSSNLNIREDAVDIRICILCNSSSSIRCIISEINANNAHNGHWLLYECVQNSKHGLHCGFNIQLHQSQIKHNTRTLWKKIMSNSINN